MLIAVAWRNIWRNKTRSLVILISVCLGLAAGIFNMAFYYGMVDQRIETVIKTEASHIQVHHPSYLANPEKVFKIDNAEQIAEQIEAIPGVKSVSKRIMLNTMIQSPTAGSGVRIMGIDPEKEKAVTNLYTKVIEGNYLDSGKRNPILIGKKLAEKLKVKLKSKVVITLQDMEGNMTAASFRVEGIYESANTTFDEMNVFVRSNDIAHVLLLDEKSAHEIAVLLNTNDQMLQVASLIAAKLPKLEVKNWRQIMPEMNLIESSLDITMFIFIIIILLALLFGIINTMLMAVLERAKELGMLMAIGMTKRKIFTMILLETVLLSLFGGLLGMGVGWMLNIYFSIYGIDISVWSEAYRSMGFDTMIYTKLSFGTSMQIALMIFATGIIAAIYPAMKALKLNPADALRIDM